MPCQLNSIAAAKMMIFFIYPNFFFIYLILFKPDVLSCNLRK
jgi:hypothetical protein